MGMYRGEKHDSQQSNLQKLQWSADLTTVNIAKNADLVNSLLLTTLLLLCYEVKLL